MEFHKTQNITRAYGTFSITAKIDGEKQLKKHIDWLRTAHAVQSESPGAPRSLTDIIYTLF